MPTVESTIIASLLNSYYWYIERVGAKFKIGLNMKADEVISDTTCTPDGNPGCVEATVTRDIGIGYMRAEWTASFIPSSDYSLTRLSLAAIHDQYSAPLIELGDFTKNLNKDTQYTVIMKEEITYNTTI